SFFARNISPTGAVSANIPLLCELIMSTSWVAEEAHLLNFLHHLALRTSRHLDNGSSERDLVNPQNFCSPHRSADYRQHSLNFLWFRSRRTTTLNLNKHNLEHISTVPTFVRFLMVLPNCHQVN